MLAGRLCGDMGNSRFKVLRAEPRRLLMKPERQRGFRIRFYYHSQGS